MGATQLGCWTMSLKVAPGEKNTPTMRLIALIRGCDSGVAGGAAGVVAIEDSSTTRLRSTAFLEVLRTSTGEYFGWGILAQKGWKLTVQTELGSSIEG